MAVKASFYNYNLHTSVWWAYHYNNIQHQTVTWIFSSVITLLVSTKASHMSYYREKLLGNQYFC